MKVSCICPTKNRREWLPGAIQCFLDQDYADRELIIVPDTLSDVVWHTELGFALAAPRARWEDYEISVIGARGATIAAKRNKGAASAQGKIIIHWDDDDWSHSRRISEQVEFLQSSGANLVGYRRMPFWRTDLGEAWLYDGEILGTSMCYRRRTWERHPFRDGWQAEDLGFALDVIKAGGKVETQETVSRMIARIHAGNAANPAYNRSQMVAHPQHWTRAYELDAHCRAWLPEQRPKEKHETQPRSE